MSFSELGLTPVLCRSLAQLGYAQPTPVQSASIPLALSGVDLMARAQTGTGKTAAFALPMIERLVVRRSRATSGRPVGLVLVPTRELAVQVHHAFTTYGAAVRLRVAHVFGGVAMGAQVAALRRGTDVVVATPGRLIDHLERRTIDLSAIEILTLDEADRMLDMGFLPPLRRVLRALPQTRQTLLFSATMSPAVVELAADFTRDPRRVDLSNGDVVAPMVTHHIHRVAPDRKRALLLHVLTQASSGQALVFCQTKRGADRLGDHLEQAGVDVGIIHGNKTQGARSRSLADFKSGRVAVLVATDIAARGLDIRQLPLVINYDLPLVAQDYIHRVGRTGRAGVAGHAVSLVTPADRQRLQEIQRLLSAPLELVAVHDFPASDVVPAPATRHERYVDRRVSDQRPRGAAPHRRSRTHSPRVQRAVGVSPHA